MDVILASLLVVLGAAVSNALDTAFKFTPTIAAWLERLLER